MTEKKIILEEDKLNKTVARIAHEIVERNADLNSVVLVGIKRRGVTFAKMLRALVKDFEGVELGFAELDITLYRDDLTEIGINPEVKTNNVPIEVAKKDVIICDDVIFTGRTARAAMEAVLSFGRPKTIQLAVVVDRGHRELPIKPDYVGKNVPTAMTEIVSVRFKEFDGENAVVLCEGGV